MKVQRGPAPEKTVWKVNPGWHKLPGSKGDCEINHMCSGQQCLISKLQKQKSFVVGSGVKLLGVLIIILKVNIKILRYYLKIIQSNLPKAFFDLMDKLGIVDI